MAETDPEIMARMEEEGIGPFLRSAREEKALSLCVISDRTRIRSYYLEGIESGSFDRLPRGPVGVGFVRAFAEEIGVDADAAAAAFRREIGLGPALNRPGADSDLQARFSPSRRQQRVKFVAAALPVLLFLLAGGGVLWLVKGETNPLAFVGSLPARIRAALTPAANAPPLMTKADGGRDAREREATASVVKEQVPERARSSLPAAPQASPGEEKENPSPGAPPRAREDASGAESAPPGNSPPAERAPAEKTPAAQDAPPEASAPAGGNPPARENPPASAAAFPLTLRIFALGDTWVRIIADAEGVEEFLLLAGEEKSWRASGKFTLTLGNIAGARVSLNGADVALPKNPSNVLRDFVITRKSLN